MPGLSFEVVVLRITCPQILSSCSQLLIVLVTSETDGLDETWPLFKFLLKLCAEVLCLTESVAAYTCLTSEKLCMWGSAVFKQPLNN